jgi:hypothetical protein
LGLGFSPCHAPASKLFLWLVLPQPV